MNNFKVKNKSIKALILLGVFMFSSVAFAYYNDDEKSLNNIFQSGIIDFVLINEEFEPVEVALNLGVGDTATKDILVTPVDSNPFKYVVEGKNFSGDTDFCEALNAKLSVEGTEMYNGPLSTLITTQTETLDTWTLDLTIADTLANKICMFDTEFRGSQTRHNYDLMEAYNDTELVSHKIQSWGLRINKLYYDVDEGEEFIPKTCEARSPGYWKNHEGCNNGSGSADWKTEVNNLSETYHGVFSDATGSQMCTAVNASSCPSGNGTSARRCRAKLHLLADEFSVVSGKLDLEAAIGGADDGNVAFDALGLDPNSTIDEALEAIEAVIDNGASTGTMLTRAQYVAERIYAFYENENPDAPYCAYSEAKKTGYGEEGENEWVEIYNQTNAPQDISGWKICDNTSCDTIPENTPEIPAEGFAIISKSASTWSFWDIPTAIVKIVLGTAIGNGLDNDNDMLILKRPDGVIVDQMNYGGDPDEAWNNWNTNTNVWDPGSVDVDEGHMLGRKPTGYDTDQPSDFVDLALPVLFLVKPDPEETGLMWMADQSYDIEWNSTNPNGPNEDITVDLYYIKDTDGSRSLNEGDEEILIINDLPNVGTYNWQLPNGFLGHIWIKVVATGPENPMLNVRVLSKRIWDPYPGFVWVTDEEEEEVVDDELVPLTEAEASIPEVALVMEGPVQEEAVSEETESTPNALEIIVGFIDEALTEPLTTTEESTPDETPVTESAETTELISETIPEEELVEETTTEEIIEAPEATPEPTPETSADEPAPEPEAIISEEEPVIDEPAPTPEPEPALEPAPVTQPTPEASASEAE